MNAKEGRIEGGGGERRFEILDMTCTISYSIPAFLQANESLCIPAPFLFHK